MKKKNTEVTAAVENEEVVQARVEHTMSEAALKLMPRGFKSKIDESTKAFEATAEEISAIAGLAGENQKKAAREAIIALVANIPVDVTIDATNIAECKKLAVNSQQTTNENIDRFFQTLSKINKFSDRDDIPEADMMILEEKHGELLKEYLSRAKLYACRWQAAQAPVTAAAEAAKAEKAASTSEETAAE
jgi:hypothetical protein